MNSEPSTRQVLNVVGQTVMRRVRDSTIEQLDQLLHGDLKAAPSRTLHERLAALPTGQVALVREIALQSIDVCLSNFLWMLEGAEKLELVMKTDDSGSLNITALSDGLSVDMHDWIERFSRFAPSIR